MCVMDIYWELSVMGRWVCWRAGCDLEMLRAQSTCDGEMGVIERY